jgi:hypothetical protein
MITSCEPEKPGGGSLIRANNLKKVAIHQPNYLPWLGFFDKISQSDVFVILDDVQFPKGAAGTWVNRTQIAINGKPRWLSVPVKRPSGLQTIEAVQYVDQTWKKSHRSIIHDCYRNADHYRAQCDLLDELFEPTEPESLMHFNLNAIKLILAKLASDDQQKMVMASSLSTTASGSARLVEIVQKVNGATYLCGAGSEGYLQPQQFEDAGLNLVFQNFREGFRPQLGTSEFIKGLSILDSLIMLGDTEVAKTLKSSQ